MTKFIYITDTHWGASPMGYQQQPGFPERLPDILSTLEDYIRAAGDIDFLLHGGDMVDAATDENIAGAAEAFSLSEIPFGFKLFAITPQSMKMTTVALNLPDIGGEYDATREYVQGRSVDRSFAIEFV